LFNPQNKWPKTILVLKLHPTVSTSFVERKQACHLTVIDDTKNVRRTRVLPCGNNPVRTPDSAMLNYKPCFSKDRQKTQFRQRLSKRNRATDRMGPLQPDEPTQALG
jgi:hypothetical protein